MSGQQQRQRGENESTVSGLEQEEDRDGGGRGGREEKEGKAEERYQSTAGERSRAAGKTTLTMALKVSLCLGSVIIPLSLSDEFRKNSCCPQNI